MSEPTFDFASLKKVDRVITRTKEKKEGVEILRTTGKNKDGAREVTFKLSDKLIGEMGLDVNSLDAFTTPDGKTAVLAVVPGNAGQFFKKKEGSAKGDRFKHNELSDAIDAAGYTGMSAFTAEAMGTQDSKNYYKIVPAAVQPAVSSPRVKKEKKAAPVAMAATVAAQ